MKPGIPEPHKCPRHGFSLVELLVVIAIIAVLMALIVPGLGEVRDRTRAVKCMGRMRQLNGALGQFSSDYNGTFPPATYAWAVNPDYNNNEWSSAKMVGKYWGNTSNHEDDTGTIYCPAAPVHNGLRKGVISYNGKLSRYEAASPDELHNGTPRSEVAFPSATVMLIDGIHTSWNAWNNNATYIGLDETSPDYPHRVWNGKDYPNHNNFAIRHAGGGNAMFVDGSARHFLDPLEERAAGKFTGRLLGEDLGTPNPYN